MNPQKAKFNLKVFQIDKSHYELAGKGVAEIIDVIRDNHKKYIHAHKEDLERIKPQLSHYVEEDFEFYSYCYNQPKDQNYWKLFLPETLTEKQDFDLIEFSFVLFIVFNSNIYCIIGGSGVSVIKKYINDYFGIELYQHFASLSEDIALVVNTRGVTGNLSQRTNMFNSVQTIRESLLYSEIPKKLKIIMREGLKEGLFKNYDLTEVNTIMDIGSYFSIKKRLSFNDLKKLIVDIEGILEDRTNHVRLSLFNRITDQRTINELDNKLIDDLINDVLLHNVQGSQEDQFDIVEVVNYRKLEKFYECYNYSIHLKNYRSSDDKSVGSLKNLYFQTTKFINEHLEEMSNREEIRSKIFGTTIKGIIDGKEVTHGTFLSHIVREVTFKEARLFRIDNQWFELDDKFLEQLKSEAVSNYKTYELTRNILNSWTSDYKDEDQYNVSHTSQYHHIFDKKIKDNIELCDIMYLDDNDMFLIHVKDNFNTHMRSLYSQITLAAQRLWNDLNNKNGSTFFLNTIDLYNKHNRSNQLSGNSILTKILDGDLAVTFVMAYRNNAYRGKSTVEKIELSQSNIARFSLVQTVNEINNFRKFKFSLIDISQLNES